MDRRAAWALQRSRTPKPYSWGAERMGEAVSPGSSLVGQESELGVLDQRLLCADRPPLGGVRSLLAFSCPRAWIGDAGDDDLRSA